MGGQRSDDILKRVSRQHAAFERHCTIATYAQRGGVFQACGLADLGQMDVQGAVAAEGGGGRQEDQYDEQDIDERYQVDVQDFVVAPGAEVHRYASRSTRRLSRLASRSSWCR